MISLKGNDVINLLKYMVEKDGNCPVFYFDNEKDCEFSIFNKVTLKTSDEQEEFVIEEFGEKEIKALEFIQILTELIQKHGDKYLLNPDVYDIEGTSSITEIELIEFSNKKYFCLK